jgi:uncharacterized protein YjdB
MVAATAADTIQVQAGTYLEQVSISGKNSFTGATEADRIILEADPAVPVGSVVLRGAGVQCTNGYALRLQQSKFITIRGLTITGAGGQAISLMGGNNQNQAIHIERNRIFGNGSSECNGGITIARGNPDTLIVNNLIYGNGRNGITFIDADGGPHDLLQNTIYANGWSGVSVARSHEVFLVNNVLTGNGTASGATGGRVGVKREDSTSPQPQGIHLLSNLLCGNRLGEIGGPALDATDAGNLTPTGTEGAGVLASPGCEVVATVYANLPGPDGLLNTADDDVSLASTSPAIDRGMDPRTLGLESAFHPLLEADFSGEDRRPQDGNRSGTPEFDIGALEVVAAQPVIAGITPTSGVHGRTVTLTVTGERLGGATALTFLHDGNPDPAITTSNLQVNTQGTELQATVALAGLAALGSRLVQVTTPGGTSDAVPTPSNTFTVLGQLTLVPDFVTLTVGGQGTLTVALSTAAAPGGLPVTLESAAPGIAIVTSPVIIPGGATRGSATMTGLAEGITNLTATASGFASGLAIVTVTAPTLVSLAISPADLSVPVGARLQLTAVGRFTDNTTRDVTGQVTWTSADPLLVSISTTGLVTALMSGTTTVTAATPMGVTASTTVTVVLPPPALAGLTPPSLTIPQGSAGTFTVTLSAGPPGETTISLTSSDAAIASVPATISIPGGSLGAPISVIGVAPGTVTITATLNGNSQHSSVTVRPAGPTLMSLSPIALQMAPGASATMTLTLTAVGETDTTVALTSSDPTIAALPAGGGLTILAGQTSQSVNVSGVAPGRATITAALNGSALHGQVTVTTAPPTVVNLRPTTLGLAEGARGELTVTLSAAQPSAVDVAVATGDSWAIGLPAGQVTVPANATTVTFPVTGVHSSVTTVTATLNGSATVAGVWVRQTLPALRTLTCPPAVSVGAMARCTLTLSAVQPTDVDIPLAVTNAAVLDVAPTVQVPGNAGSVTFEVAGLASGSAEITAGPLSETTQQAAMAVVAPTPTLVALEPSALALAPEATTTLTVTLSAVQPSATAIPINVSGAGVVWSPTTVTVPAGDLTTTVPLTGLAAGTATLTLGPLNGAQGQVSVTVSTAPATVVAMSLPQATMPDWWVAPLTVRLSPVQSAPTVVTLATDDPWAWVLSVPSAVTIPAGAAEATFPAFTFDGGTATVTAGPVNGSTAQATVSVVGTQTTRFTIVPAAATIAQAETQQFKVLHAYSTGIVQDETPWSTWTSSNPAVAKVVAKGRVTGLAPGTVTITAKSEGGGTAAAVLTVGLPPATAIAVAPVAPTLFAGGQLQFHAIATFADGSTQDVTSNVAWMIGTTSVAAITSPGGLATGVAPGSTTVTARLGNVVGTATLTVTPAILTGLTLAPTTLTRAVGDRVQFRAVGTYTDGSAQDLTSVVTWTSSNAAVAGISSPGGIAATFALGTTVITAAHSDGAMASTTLTVLLLAPTITAVAPTAGAVGSTITVMGTSLGMTTQVVFNGTPAPFTIQSGSQVIATVPWGATSGPVQIVTMGGTAISPQPFTIAVAPEVIITTPVDGATVTAGRIRVGGTVTGNTGELGVSVNGVPAPVHNGQWVVEILLVEGTQTITVTATDAIGGQAGASITLTAGPAPPARIVLQGLPNNGVPPLGVTWQVVNETGQRLVQFELDAMGTGTFDAPVPTLDGVRTTYATPGLWLSVVRATDDQGQQYSAMTTISLLDRAQIDAVLQAKWTGMRAALGAEDIDLALSFFVPEQHSRYRTLFGVLGNQLAQIGQELGDIQLVYLVEQRAKYRLRRTQLYGGQILTLTYYVYFIQDATGVWRLEEF